MQQHYSSIILQGLTVGNYKYYNNYSIVANTKVKDYISKESIYVQKVERYSKYWLP